ncbi:U-scoloptoxin(19)-Tl1a [Colias croceus]|uniref:U-scoloptoxin(19)-Tl1a n=1 Tax=Colias crocea TaxID=72248 RepID=UPI001E280285|nr:U-scoloptoxin(19)-Tl1a [Colias croceus]
MKTAIVVCAILYSVVCNEEDFRIIDSIVQEKPCSSVGGICTIAADCPKGHLSEKTDLCPSQQKQGVECCFGLSLKETRCEKHGGTCKKQSQYCNPRLVFDASDCGSDEKCCILTL